jgi:hypothetical protein
MNQITTLAYCHIGLKLKGQRWSLHRARELIYKSGTEFQYAFLRQQEGKDRKEQRAKRQMMAELAEESIERVDCPSILSNKPLLVEDLKKIFIKYPFISVLILLKASLWFCLL